MGWTEYIAAFFAFGLSHIVPVRPQNRVRLVAILGANGFTWCYSALSLAVLTWLIGASGRAPFVVIWSRLSWQTWVPVMVMLPICLIAALAIARPNPFSFGGARNHQFDPSHPRIIHFTRHPLLWVLAIWATAHLVPNGDLAHVILFGVFSGFAWFGMRIIDRRKQRLMGKKVWEHLLAQTKTAPLTFNRQDLFRVLIGIAAYLALLALHPIIIGVSPLP